MYFVEDWRRELDELLDMFSEFTDEEKAAKRAAVASWYRELKAGLRAKFINDIKTLFK